MSKVGGGLAMSGMDSDFEQEDIDMDQSEVPSVASPQPAAMKTKAKDKTAKAKQEKATHPILGAKKTTAKKKAAEDRAPLTDISNGQSNGDGADHSLIEVSTEALKKEPAKKPRARKPKIEDAPAKKTASKVAARVVVEEIPETQPLPQQSFEKRTIPETQPDAMDLECSDNTDYRRAERQTSVIRTARIPPRRRERSISRTRGRSVSTDRGGSDPTLRRKLGEMTQKFEALETRYTTLKDVGVTEAEANFERFKKQAEENTKAAEALIATLRATVSARGDLSSESSALRSQVTTLNTQVEAVKSEKKTLETSLEKAQSEIKALQAKLATARASSAPAPTTTSAPSADASKVPGSAVKPSHGPPRTVLVGSAEAAKEAQKRMLKEEMYSDLSGLIIRDVKRREADGEDVYDCIQTGRNGTLHFHLTVANPTAGAKTPGGTGAAYEDAEFTYTPHLDEKRDRDLIEILPDYLTEEICFPRNNAAKFYGRVVDCMTKRVEIVEAEGSVEPVEQ